MPLPLSQSARLHTHIAHTAHCIITLASRPPANQASEPVAQILLPVALAVTGSFPPCVPVGRAELPVKVVCTLCERPWRRCARMRGPCMSASDSTFASNTALCESATFSGAVFYSPSLTYIHAEFSVKFTRSLRGTTLDGSASAIFVGSQRCATIRRKPVELCQVRE